MQRLFKSSERSVLAHGNIVELASFPRTESVLKENAFFDGEYDGNTGLENLVSETKENINLMAIGVIGDCLEVLNSFEEVKNDICLSKADYFVIRTQGNIIRFKNSSNPESGRCTVAVMEEYTSGQKITAAGSIILLH
eukprot:TRINITY_DN316_c0_g2_i2.p1 TRINITY_DN316_c0_g2~~TRINITY_DN316_c0_g2_i2.p1  ORF type:complete len:138 (-),score=34.50 TRINITY_DN316_c0_g2_i2:93-506(-)